MACSKLADLCASPARVESARLLAFSNDAEIERLRSDQLALAAVGDYWLRDCTRLTALDCSGLSPLTTVGYYWLHSCTNLTALDCTGLTQLALLSVTIGCPTAPV